MSESKKRFRILSIDGGGVRGVIPARILQWIEERSGKPISQLFDLIVGTSTGGLITLGLGCPDQKNSPKYSAEHILEVYKEHAGDIFRQSVVRSFFTGKGLWAAKYNRKSYDVILNNLFGDTRLSQAICPVLIPTYSLSLGSPNFFASSRCSRTNDNCNCLMRDVAGATSAAPTYFPPKEFRDCNGTRYVEVDAGIYANNPQAIAITEAFQIEPNLRKEDLFIFSIGTGSPKFDTSINKLGNAGVLGWFLKANLIDIMLDAHTDWYTEQTAMLYPTSVRLQPSLPENLGRMDDASPDHISGLIGLANDYVQRNEKLLSGIMTELV
jgi:patatin-like phospholipase/acyl hydrolase